MNTKAKKFLKIAGKFEAISLLVYYLSGKPKTATGKPKSTSILLNLFGNQAAATEAAKKTFTINYPTTPEGLTISNKKPVGLIMWDAFFNSDWTAPDPIFTKLLVNIATEARVKLTRLIQSGIYLVPFWGRQNLPAQNVEVYSNVGYSAELERNTYDTEIIPVTVDFNFNQSAMDKSIQYAKEAGFQFMIFNYYAFDSPMSQGRLFFAASTQKNGMKYCFMGPGLGFPNDRQFNIDYIAAEMRKPYYFKHEGKPVLYVDPEKTADTNAIIQAYGGEVYTVAYIGGEIPNPGNHNAGGSYCSFGDNFTTNHAYSGIVNHMVRSSAEFLTQHPDKDLIPTLTTGFENYQKLNPLDRPGYTKAATDPELKEAIQLFNGILVNAKAPFGTVYAGNEFVECGRCVLPVLYPNGTENRTTLEIFKQNL
jgi:hypothetical protein